VIDSRRDGKTLKDISEKLGIFLKELHGPSTTTNVTSINQQGGITAGQVTITGSNAIKVEFTQLSANEQKEDQGSPFYESKWRVTLSGQVPEFTISASSPALTKLRFFADRSGVSSHVEGTTSQGDPFHTIQNAFGSHILVLHSRVPTTFRITYGCTGALCVGP
jgi:hypothetical protein